MEQKRENLLNLALETPQEERIRTENLNVGYEATTRSWEVIAKYHGALAEAVRGISAGIRVEQLIAGYAILTVPEELVDAVTDLEEIEYLEKPKRFFYSLDPAGTFDVLDSACFTEVTSGPPYLRGRGVLVLVADSGIDWKRREFRRANGDTRIRFLWDQTLVEAEGAGPPEDFYEGVEFDAARIDLALAEQDPERQFRLVPSIDVSGHGTAVAGIAVGANPESGYMGAAPEAELLIVKLGPADFASFPRTVEVMRAVTWGLRKAEQLRMPLVINLSFGNTYGPHDGGSLLERFLDNAAEIGRTVICVGSGNEGAAGGHTAGNLLEQTGAQAGRPPIPGVARRVREELAVDAYERNLRIQFWQNYSDVYRVYLIAPGGTRVELTAPINGGKFTVYLEDTKILAYQGEPAPYSVAKELYLEFLPETGNYITGGIWAIELEPVEVVTGQYDLYLSDSITRSTGTFFYTPTPQMTITVPGTAGKVITVGAFDSTYDAYADFSGRGYTETARIVGVVMGGMVKPDIVAPGVNITVPDLFGGYALVSGTSFSTPIAAGAAALLMEWGIVRGNDPFLYGEKVKAYLRAGARPLRGETVYPNDRLGFGALCVKDSLP